MGNEHSSDFTDPDQKQRTLFRRSSSLPTKMKAPKLKNLGDFQYAASYLSFRVQNFNGARHDPQYQEIENQIVEVSMELQRYRVTLLRDSDRSAADGIQKSISDCLSALLRKAQENEGGNLDAGAVESSSFVAQREEERRMSTVTSSQQSLDRQPQKSQRKSKSRQSTTKTTAKYHRRTQTLQQIERTVLELKANITNAIFCQQTASFERYESKLKSVCMELELVDVEEHSPLSEKKKELFDILIKCNSNLRKAKKRMQRQVAIDIPDHVLARSEMDSLEEEIHRTEQVLESEEGQLGDLKAKFELLLEKVSNVRENADIEERKKIAAEIVRSNLKKIELKEIEVKLQQLRDEVEGFDGVKYSEAFVKLDQQLRHLWDEVSNIEGSEERKFKTIGEIQSVIQKLLRKSEENESILYENSEHLKQVQQMQQQRQSQQQGQQQEQQQKQMSPKEPLPTPKEQPQQKTLEGIVDEFISNWHSLKLHTESKKWNQTEKARIKIKLSNVLSNIQDILDIIDDQMEQKQETKSTPSEAQQQNHKPVVHVKPETSKSTTETLKLEEKVTLRQEVPVRDVGERLSENTMYFNFTSRKDEASKRLSELEANVRDLKGKVKAFNEAIRNTEYEKIKNDIQNCVDELKALQPKGKTLLEEVYELAEELEIKIAENQSENIKTRANLKALIERLQNLKKKIDNFVGAYRNILYNRIEEDLKKLLEELDGLNPHGDKKLLYAISQTKQKAQQYTKILESKSSKPESSPSQRDSTISFNNIQKVRAKLLEIKETAEQFSGLTNDPAYQLIRGELNWCTEELKTIQDYGRTSIIETKQQYFDYIEEMHKYLDQKVLQGAQSRIQDEDYVVGPVVTEKKDPYKQMQQIEESFAVTARKVEDFNGKSTDKLYAYLDEMLILTLIALDNLNIKDGEMTIRRNQMTKKVHQYSKLLGEKAKAKKKEEERESLEQIRKICNSIKFEIDNGINDTRYSELNERLVNLLIEVDEMKAEDEAARQYCKERITEVLRLLQSKINYQIKFVSDLDGIQI